MERRTILTKAFFSGSMIAVLSLAFSTQIHAECLALVKGAIAFDVEQCRQIDPIKDLAEARMLEHFKGLTKSDKDALVRSYMGTLITGKVVYSKAVRSGLSPEKGALNGDRVSLFLKPGTSQCAVVQAKRVAGIIDEACCDGGADAPCLLNTSYVLNELNVIGVPKSAAGDQKRETLKKSPDYIKAMGHLQKKQWKESAALMEKVKTASQLDIAGYYFLAYAYRQLDRCARVIPLLQHIVQENEKGQVWGDQLEYVKKGNYLLARCLAKTNKPGEAALILNSFLIEPKRFREEIIGSLKHPDFGWINATKEYQEYRREARKALDTK